MNNVRINLLIKCGAICHVILRIKLPYHIRSREQGRIVSQVANATFVSFSTNAFKRNQLILLDQIGRGFHVSVRIVLNGDSGNNTT